MILQRHKPMSVALGENPFSDSLPLQLDEGKIDFRM